MPEARSSGALPAPRPYDDRAGSGPEPDGSSARLDTVSVLPAARRAPVPAQHAGSVRRRRRLDVPPLERWAVVTILVCTAAFVVLTALVAVPGPVRDFDWWVWHQGFEVRYPGKRLMTALTVLGQRGPALVLAFLVAVWIGRRLGTRRPVLVLAGSQLLLNVVVGALKYGLGRAKAETGSAELFAGGTLYPGGHSSNTVVVWGVLAYLLIAYAGVRRRRLVIALAAVPSFVVAAATTFIGSHWVTDILGGWLVGIALLALTITLDRGWGRAGPRRPGRAAAAAR